MRASRNFLWVTRTGRLALLELKAKENLNLLLQAADYWSRICQRLSDGGLQRYGYFSGLELSQKAAAVYLVAPGLRFHPSTDDLLHYLNPDIELVRIGLAESWRRGIRVMMRQ